MKSTPDGREPDASYDVRIWKIDRYQGVRATTFTVRWRVAGRRHRRTFATAKLAEAFRAELLIAARRGAPFHLDSGVPSSLQLAEPERTWVEHAEDYVRVKWPTASPRHRRGIAEALTDVTSVLLPEGSGRPPEPALRRALYSVIFNASPLSPDVPIELEDSLAWIHGHSPPMRALDDAAVVRRALDRLMVRADGTLAAPSTATRKRATLHSVLEYAVELELFTSNPLKRVRWKAPKATDLVDRRVVVNPAQARALLAAVWDQDPALAAYFACLYFAGLRPAEARNLRATDCTLPESGWGLILLTGSHQRSGTAWTDSGSTDEERALKHRGRRDTRPVPAHPELVRWLRRHLQTFEVGGDGRLFVTRVGRFGRPIARPYLNPIASGTVYAAWHRARESALNPSQIESQLARRPYDLRHACLSTWLNAGVSPARVAAWAGHSVEVLLRVYAKCVEGDDTIALRRIEDTLGDPDGPPSA